ncbi:hypothetical protein O2W14_12865 [Modestobacter sp. VKM Ac-2986]|nr:hypothetical protein [Modestobacter sp. VKM Ac-2986]MCZ2829726.1 hypothetical protein [Modestobacter sp. VKM Ac-2986]
MSDQLASGSSASREDVPAGAQQANSVRPGSPGIVSELALTTDVVPA